MPENWTKPMFRFAFMAELTLPDCQGFCNASKIYQTICLLHSDQVHLHLLHGKFFGCSYSIMAQFKLIKHKFSKFGSARGVMVIVTENGHGDTSSNPGRDWLHFT